MPYTKDVSIILPIHNEALNLEPLIERIIAVMNKYSRVHAWEAILVDDASTDNSWPVMQALQARFPQYLFLERHERRSGQKGCQMTGFNIARGWVTILMDADLQVFPEEIPLLLDKLLLENYEMVCTYNDPKRGGKHRGWVSAIGNLFMKWLFNSPVRDAGSNFMGVQTRYLKGVRLVANDQRYLLPIAMRRGLTRIAEVGCIFGVRGYGQSKYKKWKKTLSGFPEMLQLKRRLKAGFYDQPPVAVEDKPPQEY